MAIQVYYIGADQVMLVYGDTKKQDSQLVLLHWQYSSVNVLDVGISMSKGGTYQESLVIFTNDFDLIT